MGMLVLIILVARDLDVGLLGLLALGRLLNFGGRLLRGRGRGRQGGTTIGRRGRRWDWVGDIVALLAEVLGDMRDGLEEGAVLVDAEGDSLVGVSGGVRERETGE